MTKLEAIGLLAVEEYKARETAEGHQQEAEECGYDNDPTGSMWVNESWTRLASKSGELSDAIKAFLEEGK